MKRWLLDDGPLGLLARHFDPTWSWPAATLHVMKEVASGAPADKSGRRQQLFAMVDGAGASSVLVVDGGAPTADVLFRHVRPSAATATKDLGEDASIAYCIAEDTASTFVTMDKRAAYVALAELGSARVSTPYDLWAWLRESGLIMEAQWQLLAEATAKQDQGMSRVPLRFTGATSAPLATVVQSSIPAK
jgi:hypothetical protein